MPIWLRKFTFNEIDKYNKDQNKKAEAARKGKGKKSMIDSSGQVNRPTFKNKSSYK